MLNTLFWFLLYLFLLPNPAHAYLDPGTGSYITQLTIGFLAGILYLLKVNWRRILSLFKKIFQKSDTANGEKGPYKRG